MNEILFNKSLKQSKLYRPWHYHINYLQDAKTARDYMPILCRKCSILLTRVSLALVSDSHLAKARLAASGPLVVSGLPPPPLAPVTVPAAPAAAPPAIPSGTDSATALGGLRGPCSK